MPDGEPSLERQSSPGFMDVQAQVDVNKQVNFLLFTMKTYGNCMMRPVNVKAISAALKVMAAANEVLRRRSTDHLLAASPMYKKIRAPPTKGKIGVGNLLSILLVYPAYVMPPVAASYEWQVDKARACLMSSAATDVLNARTKSRLCCQHIMLVALHVDHALLRGRHHSDSLLIPSLLPACRGQAADADDCAALHLQDPCTGGAIGRSGASQVLSQHGPTQAWPGHQQRH